MSKSKLGIAFAFITPLRMADSIIGLPVYYGEKEIGKVTDAFPDVDKMKITVEINDEEIGRQLVKILENGLSCGIGFSCLQLKDK